ncbi:ABC transporter permease [Actinokineospora auranticolor]|uniref:Putative ABC transport system permease protein n=1 Tax=Actinokineospora auranticolor TaxID=155976 RepID=A0A2S6H1H4_9PSEU|nr:ABC transporter permease [Actinokineospora auranticolor]PPK71266.1 putative ABC transport system permease protein [Actinokineospora auranticolor]
MLSVRTLRHRWVSLVGTFVALGLGVAILAMSGLVMSSARAKVPERYSGAAVLVASPEVSQEDNAFTPSRPWSTEVGGDLVDRVSSVPGVARAVEDRSFYAQAVIDGRPVGGASAEALGHNWNSSTLASYRVEGAAPARDDEVVLDRSLGLAPGSRVSLLTSAGPSGFTVSGTVDADAYFVTEAVAERLSGGLRVIGLDLSPGADEKAVVAAVRAVVGDRGRVLSGEARAELEVRGEAKVRWIGDQVLTAMGGLGAFVCVFMVASTFAFAVSQRRREFGLLRLVGATPRQVRVLVFGEALVVGVLAGLAGVALGAASAPVVGGLLVDAGLEPAGFAISYGFFPLAGASGIGVVVAMLGVWAASRRAGRVRPIEALRTAEVDPKPMTRARWIGGGVAMAVGVGLFLLTATGVAEDLLNAPLYAAMALIVGLTLLGPVVLPPLVRLVPATLVRESALTAIRRTTSTVSPVLITVVFAVLVSGMFSLTVTGVSLEKSMAIGPSTVVSARDTPGLSDEVVSTVGGASLLPTTLYTGSNDHLDAVGVSPEAFAKAHQGLSVVEGSLNDLTGTDTMAVNSPTASRMAWHPGSTADITFADGSTTKLRVVAVFSKTSAAASALVTRETVRTHDPSALTSAIYVDHPVVGADWPALGAQVMTRAEYAEFTEAEDNRLVGIFVTLLLAMSLGYSALAIVNTLVMATADRASDFRVLRLAGATRRQVLGSVAAESALAVAIGSLLGVVVAFATLATLTSGVAHNLPDADVSFSPPWGVLAGTVALCLALAVGAGLFSANSALKADRAVHRMRSFGRASRGRPLG